MRWIRISPHVRPITSRVADRKPDLARARDRMTTRSSALNPTECTITVMTTRVNGMRTADSMSFL
jgi:hypothetical protein